MANLPRLRVVLDTNTILRSISRYSKFAVILDRLYDSKYDLYITTDIILEYKEKISEIFSKETAELISGAISLLPNVKRVEVFYQMNLITADPDDNKFTDCAFAANAHFMVTNDRHFNVLKSIEFPKIEVKTAEEFVELLISE